MPNNQADMYEFYIENRLKVSKSIIKKKNLTDEQIKKCAIEIAKVMFSTTILGLDASLYEIQKQLPNYEVSIQDVIEVLVFSRLGRLGGCGEKRFSFAHRRFCEYFLVQSMIQSKDSISFEAIPKDTRLRDSLVLYCEIANKNEGRRIAKL